MSKPYIHSESSARRCKGKAEDYCAIHQLMDSSKAVEPSNLHRIFFHSSLGCFWVEKIFGLKAVNSDNKTYSPRDIAEQHCIEDFRGFIPALSDYVSLIIPNSSDQDLFVDFQQENSELFANAEIKKLMMSPLSNTGVITSLFVTHNSWFIGDILPRIFPDINIKIKNSLSPSIFLNRMKMENWINNGAGTPPSNAKILEYRKSRTKSLDLIAPPIDNDIIKISEHLKD